MAKEPKSIENQWLLLRLFFFGLFAWTIYEGLERVKRLQVQEPA